MPRVVDHQQRRDEIVAAAWRAIADDGLEGATMRRIAEAAGCATGKLAHYFDSRSDILVAALRTVHVKAAARTSAVQRRVTGRGVLRAVVLEGLPLDDERRTEWRVWLAFWGQAVVSDDLRAEHDRRYREWRRLLTRLVRDGVGRGELRVGDVRGEVDQLVALVDGLGMQGVLSPTPATVRAIVAAVDAHLRSIAV
jgi:AcrR family transcriptional regulator